MTPALHDQPPLRDPLSSIAIELARAAVTAIASPRNFEYSIAAEIQRYVAGMSPDDRAPFCWRMRDVCAAPGFESELARLIDEKFGREVDEHRRGDGPALEMEVVCIDSALAETANRFEEKMATELTRPTSAGTRNLQAEIDREIESVMQKVFCVRDQPYDKPAKERERFTSQSLKESGDRYFERDFDLFAHADGGHVSRRSLEKLFLLHNRSIVEMHMAIAIEALSAHPRASEIGTYGAKGANLETLRIVVEALAPVFELLNLSVKVPDFRRVPTTVYDQYATTGVSNSPVIDQIALWMAEHPEEQFLVRSSAERSEDGEKLGAGKYLTVKIPGTASRELLGRAICAVYESVNSDEAVAYRREHGIEGKERMGVVVQCEARNPTRSYESPQLGYVNSVRYGIPNAIDVVFQDRHVPQFGLDRESNIIDGRTVAAVLSRSEIESRLGSGLRSLGHGFIVPPDIGRSDVSPSDMQEVAMAALFIERAYGCPVQIEFASAGYELNLVQVRPLPTAWTRPSDIRFPENETPLAHANAVGIVDKVLPVLGEDESNHQREGLVILSGSYMGSSHTAWIDRIVPKTGAVLLLTNSESMNGHVESCCLERGVAILTFTVPEESSSDRYTAFDPLSGFLGGDILSWLGYRDTLKPSVFEPSSPKSIRVVCNGLTGRLYAPPSSE